MDGIVAFIVGTLIGVAIHSYIKKEKIATISLCIARVK